MDRQIARKHVQTLTLQCISKPFITNASEQTISFCANLFVPKRLQPNIIVKLKTSHFVEKQC